MTRAFPSCSLSLLALLSVGCIQAGFTPNEVTGVAGGDPPVTVHSMTAEGTATVQYELAVTGDALDVVRLQLMAVGDGQSQLLAFGEQGADSDVVHYENGSANLVVSGAADVAALTEGTAIRGEFTFTSVGGLVYGVYCLADATVTLEATTSGAEVEGGNASVTIDCDIGADIPVVDNPNECLPLPNGELAPNCPEEVNLYAEAAFPNQTSFDATERYLVVLRDDTSCTNVTSTDPADFFGRSAVSVADGQNPSLTQMPSPLEEGTVGVYMYAYSGPLVPCQNDSWCDTGTCTPVAGGVSLCQEADSQTTLTASGCEAIELAAPADCRGLGDFNGCGTVDLATP